MTDADDTTIKIRTYSGQAGRIAPQSNLTEEQNNALELVKKNAQLEEEEKKKSLGHLKIIEQLQESLKLEQAKTVEMAKKITLLEAKEKEFAVLENKANKMAELESKVKELTDALGKISAISAAGKAG